MNHQDGGELTALGRLGEVAADFAVAAGGGNGGGGGDDARIVLRHLLCPGIVGPQTFPEADDRHATDGETFGAFEEVPAFDVAVNEQVKQVQEFLWVVRCFFAVRRPERMDFRAGTLPAATRIVVKSSLLRCP